MCDALYIGGCGGGLRLLEVSEASEVLEAMRCVLLCMLEAVDGDFCLLEVLMVLEAEGAGRDAPCAARFAGGRGGCA